MELVITIAIVAIAGTAMTIALANLLAKQSDGFEEAQATVLAQSYLEEIAARRYDETTPVGGVPPCSPVTTACSAATAFDDGESRATIDDVDDYDGLLEQPPLDATGAVRVGFEQFAVAVNVQYADVTTVTALGLDDPTDAKIITVTVTTPSGSQRPFTQLRGNY